uniref:C-type lectin domain-containing protein n=1 Tax=Myripristis murdjan TaxID=586833 RepID=A0A667ZMZ5_9TELE
GRHGVQLVACCLGILCVVLITAIRRCNPCQRGWLLSPSESSCYLVITTNNYRELKTWEEAGEDCRQRNADLVVIENKQEQEFIHEISDSDLYGYWIGLRRTSGVWKWVDGSDLTER